MDIILLETHLFDPKFSSGFLFIDWIVFTNCDSGFDKLKEKKYLGNKCRGVTVYKIKGQMGGGELLKWLCHTFLIGLDSY